MNLAVCVLFFEKVDQTIKCVTSLLSSGANIYVLNNNSSQESVEKAQNFCRNYSQISLLHADKNLGISGGRNYLIRHTEETWMFFIDNDIYINDKKWFYKLKRHILKYPDADVIIPKLYSIHILSREITPSVKLVNGKIEYGSPNENIINNFPGGASVINRKLFDKVGLYDEDIFAGGLEDLDLAIRAIKMKYQIKAVKIDDISLLHEHIFSDKQVDANAASIRYSTDPQNRSQDKIIRKHNLCIDNDTNEWLISQYKMHAEKTQHTRWFKRLVYKQLIKLNLR